MELIKNQIQFCDRILERTSAYEESTDAIVPDSYPDIARIVYAAGNAVIKDESPQNDRVLVSGSIKTTVLYQPEGGEELCELSVPLSFAHIEDAKGLTADSTCFVACRVVHVDARAVNSRKLSITAKLCFETSAYEERELVFTQDIEQAETLPLEIMHRLQTISLPCAVQCREFTLLEDIDVPSANDAHLLHTRCTLSLTESRAMYGKAVLKGDMHLHCLIKENGGLRTTDHTLPFTQILDCEGIKEGQTVGVRFAVHRVDCELHEGGLLSIGVGACAMLLVTQAHELRTIQDLYQTTHALDVQTRNLRVSSVEARGALRGEMSETLQIGARVGRVIDTDAVCYHISQEDAGHLKLTTAVSLLIQPEEGAPFAVNRTLSFPIALPTEMEGGTAQNLSLVVTATPMGDDSVTVRMGVNGDLFSRCDCTINDVTTVEAGAPNTDARDAVTLVLRFVDGEEPLWELAKRYHTTVRAIQGANAMAADANTARGRMLLIPICEK